MLKVLRYLGKSVTSPKGKKCPAWIIECAYCGARTMFAIAGYKGETVEHTCAGCGVVDTFNAGKVRYD